MGVTKLDKTGCWLALLVTQSIKGPDTYTVSLPLIWFSNKDPESVAKELLNNADTLVKDHVPELINSQLVSCDLQSLSELDFEIIELMTRHFLAIHGFNSVLISSDLEVKSQFFVGRND